MRVNPVIQSGSDVEDDFDVVSSSFEVFYSQQRRRLIALAYAVSGSRIAAEDLAQEALLAAFETWESVSTKQNPDAWVRRILLNKAASSYRRRLIELKAAARQSGRHDVVSFPEVTGEIERIWAEVRRLPRRQAQVIALAHVEGLNQVEIANTLGISKESVSTHMRRARQTLISALGMEDTG